MHTHAQGGKDRVGKLANLKDLAVADSASAGVSDARARDTLVGSTVESDTGFLEPRSERIDVTVESVD